MEEMIFKLMAYILIGLFISASTIMIDAEKMDEERSYANHPKFWSMVFVAAWPIAIFLVAMLRIAEIAWEDEEENGGLVFRWITRILVLALLAKIYFRFFA